MLRSRRPAESLEERGERAQGARLAGEPQDGLAHLRTLLEPGDEVLELVEVPPVLRLAERMQRRDDGGARRTRAGLRAMCELDRRARPPQGVEDHVGLGEEPGEAV